MVLRNIESATGKVTEIVAEIWKKELRDVLSHLHAADRSRRKVRVNLRLLVLETTNNEANCCLNCMQHADVLKHADTLYVNVRPAYSQANIITLLSSKTVSHEVLSMCLDRDGTFTLFM